MKRQKKLAVEIVSSANAEIDSIKSKIAQSVDNEIVNLNKNFDEKKLKLKQEKLKKRSRAKRLRRATK